MSDDPNTEVTTASNSTAYVLFPLGKKRFALPARVVTELARPDRLHTFPHGTPTLSGVLVRRGCIIPVWDIAQVVIGAHGPERRFYLVVNRRFDEATERTAIPVSGECELVSGEAIPPAGRLPQYVTSLLPLEKEIIEVLDLEILAQEGRA